MPRLELYAFRYRSEVTGKWVTARYKAELHEIAARHDEFEIIGPPEIRNADPRSASFNSYRTAPEAELNACRSRLRKSVRTWNGRLRSTRWNTILWQSSCVAT